MTSPETLPVWARILLGIPVDDAAAKQCQESARTACDRDYQAPSHSENEAGQNVLSFDLDEPERKWRWPRVLRPVVREFPS